MTYSVVQPAGGNRWIGIAGIGAALGALTLFDGPVLCPFRRCTGGYCPLCGATRSAASLARLDPLAALEIYPALPFVAVAIVLALWPDRLGRQRSDRLLLGLAALVIVVWVARLGIGDIPRPSELSWPIPIR